MDTCTSRSRPEGTTTTRKFEPGQRKAEVGREDRKLVDGLQKLEGGLGAVSAATAGGSRPRPLEPWLAVLVLGAVTVLWGAQHATIKATLEDADGLDAAALNLLRFALAAACFSPWLPASSGCPRARLEWRGGAELGLWLFLGFGLQSAGLLYTTAQRSGLLLYLNVKLVPFLALFLFGREVPPSAWLSAAAALFGTLLVAGDGASGVPPNRGDALSLAAASASAMFILRLETLAPATDARALNAVGMLTVAALCVPGTLAQAVLAAPQELLVGPPNALAGFALGEASSRTAGVLLDHWLAVVYLGVVTTAFTSWLQTVGQRSVPATTASVIYALDPLWGCLFAYFLLGEVLGPQSLAGCAVLLGVWGWQLLQAQTPRWERPRAEKALVDCEPS